ncbi:hypothetical protein IU469_35230, partial [Nocardia puris]|nr:hypothetical protein [Nocardia puris]
MPNRLAADIEAAVRERDAARIAGDDRAVEAATERIERLAGALLTA